MKGKILSSILIAIALSVTTVLAYDDTYVKIQEMVNDLGAPPERAKNNGKLQRCADGGTKKITIKKSKGGTIYEGIYKNCREYGRIRDGNVTITVGN